MASDSKIAGYWTTRRKKTVKTYVNNRVTTVIKIFPANEIRQLGTSDNWADCET